MPTVLGISKERPEWTLVEPENKIFDGACAAADLSAKAWATSRATSVDLGGRRVNRPLGAHQSTQKPH